jgi:hypothetical protein
MDTHSIKQGGIDTTNTSRKGKMNNNINIAIQLNKPPIYKNHLV